MDLMFEIDARIVHPCYGAGTITRVDEKTIGGNTNAYYVIHTLARSMDLMVPVSRVEDVGLRPVGDADALRVCLAHCGVAPGQDEIDSDLRSRQNTMREEIKSGSYEMVVGIARHLFFLHNRRPLGTVDRQLYDQAKEFLAAELALAADVEYDAAMEEVEDKLAEMLEGLEE